MLCIFMAPVTKVPKLLGEILLILKHLFSLIHTPVLQGFCILQRERDLYIPLSQISLCSQVCGC